MKIHSPKFIAFLENLKDSGNSLLVDTIQKGFNQIYESLSTDDANLPKPHLKTDSPFKSAVANPNFGNEYFNQTLPTNTMNIVNKAQSGGSKTAMHPKAGRWVVTLDPLKSGHGTNPNANTSDANEYAGDSGGYTLGGSQAKL